MKEMEATGDFLTLANEKIQFGENLLKSLDKFKSLEGIQKLKTKINQELKFLKKVFTKKLLKKEHLQCSNLKHFSALITVLENVTNCVCVSKVFLLCDRKLVVDIVCNGGLTWMKVIARNPRSLSQICEGDASYGIRSVIDQAHDYLECAEEYPCLFQTPKIVFVFSNGISQKIAEELEALGIIVQGNKINDSTERDLVCNESFLQNKDETISDDLSSNNIDNILKVNLDVSAMLAYCSSVTNGGANLYDFTVPVLNQQAAWERHNPQKPILEKFFQGKKLYCCQTAKDNFENIVATVGGSSEKIRAEELLAMVTVLPDDATAEDTDLEEQHTEIFNNVQLTSDKILQLGGKIRQRSLVIFTFGDRIQAVTVTANDGFVRAAKQQGINFVVFVHQSRALTEQKEQTRGVKLTT